MCAGTVAWAPLVAAAGIVLIVVGSLGPWAEAASRDGILTLVLAVVAGALLVLGRLRPLLVLCAVLVLAVVIYDLLDVRRAGLTVGWGLWLAAAGGLVLAAGITVGRR